MTDAPREKFYGHKNLVALPINKTNELRVTTHFVNDNNGNPKKYVDIREFYFPEGPMGAPSATKKGAKFPEELLPTIVEQLLKDMSPALLGPKLDDLRRILDSKV